MTDQRRSPAGEISESVRRPLRRRLALGCGVVFGLVGLAILGVFLWGLAQVRGSLPELDGEVKAAGLAAPVAVHRDGLGVPTIQGESREDVAFGLGFAHAQDRFFQMDLLRRQSSGELAALFGSVLQDYDRKIRMHSFRRHAQRIEEELPPEYRAVLEAYADGVNAGFASLKKPPIEYFLAGGSPEPWKTEDSILVLLAMFVFLGDDDGDYDFFLRQLQSGLPPELYEFLTPTGTSWDSPMEGEAWKPPVVPGPEICSLRSGAGPSAAERIGSAPEPDEEAPPALATNGASNAWVLAGDRTASGAALLAADLHVELTVPILWYRAALAWEGEAGTAEVSGMTVPGAPLVVVGSNGSVAWAFTNSRVDTTDLVRLETVAGNPEAYQTPSGPESFEVVRESIAVKGGEAEVLETRWTQWGPVMEEDGALFALRWVAHEAAAVNLNLLAMETAAELEEALDVARGSGLPALNFFVAAADGRIGWTMAGQLPGRSPEVSGRGPTPWERADESWDRWLMETEVPRVVDPAAGYLWNANNRTVGGDGLRALGDGNYVLGARAGQIETALEGLDSAAEEDMLEIQLDDRAVFLERWQELFLEVVDGADCGSFPLRCEARRYVEEWGGRAAVDSVGYTLVRNFRHGVGELVFEEILKGCGFGGEEEAPPYYDEYGQAEGPLWVLVSERPEHLLPRRLAAWDDFLLEAADRVIEGEETDDEAVEEEGPDLSRRNWGNENRLAMRHLFSSAVPFLGRWLDMPADPLAGDSYMPRLQLSRYGASQRLAVSPGREAEGYFHMPGGQSGHPLSRHYRDGHQAWLEGEATPFLPGPTVHTLTLIPDGAAPQQAALRDGR